MKRSATGWRPQELHFRHTTRNAGVFLILLSALVFSTAGLFTKGISADAWSIIFWRGLFASIFTMGYIFARGTFDKEVLAMGKSGWVVALLGASGTAAFIPAFKLTSIANVSLIYATAPFVAVAVAWAWFREKPRLVILLSSALAIVGVLIIVRGSIGGIRLKGDGLALFMTVLMSLIMVIYRRYPNTPAAGPSILSSLFLLPFGFYLGDPLAASFREVAIMAAFGMAFAIASVTLSEGARRVPPGETALLSALETPLAPVLAWLVLSELPTNATLVGGAVILLAVFGSQLVGLKTDV
jgi:drug/metabolite transporter (DMT)-like permease